MPHSTFPTTSTLLTTEDATAGREGLDKGSTTLNEQSLDSTLTPLQKDKLTDGLATNVAPRTDFWKSDLLEFATERVLLGFLLGLPVARVCQSQCVKFGVHTSKLGKGLHTVLHPDRTCLSWPYCLNHPNAIECPDEEENACQV